MSIQNVAALLEMYRQKKCSAVRTPSGIQFFGMRNLTAAQRESLLNIPQADLDAALRWQK